MIYVESNSRKIWHDTWLKKPETIEAIRLLEAQSGSSEDHAITRVRIFDACNNAAHYDAAKDPGKMYREEMAAQKRAQDKLRRAAHVLACASRRGDTAMQYAFPIGSESNVRLCVLEGDRRMDAREMLSLWFAELEANLEGKLLELDGGPFLNNFTVGNLLFAKSKRGAGAPTSVATMLAFELTIYLRWLTAGRASGMKQRPELMPEYGNPCESVVHAFMAATLGTSIDSQSTVSDLLRRGLPKGTGLVAWSRASD